MRVNAYLIATSVIFGIVALLHILRLAYAWPVAIGTMPIAVSWSWIGLIVSGGLCAWAIALLRART